MYKTKLIVLYLFTTIYCAGSIRILVIFPMPAQSHFTLGFRIAEELANRGHNVTFINPYPQKTPIKNLEDISVDSLIKTIDAFKADLYEFGKKTYLGMLEFFSNFGFAMTEGVLRDQNVQKLWNSSRKFDLIVMEHFNNDALAMFSYRFSCPLVYVAPGPVTMFNNHIFSNPSPPSYIPHIISGFTSDMTLWQRLKNTYYKVVGELYQQLVMLPQHNQIVHKIFPDTPNLENVLYNASLMLVSSHPSIHEPAPLQPAIKEIGGYHVNPAKPLSRDIKEILDNAKDGAIIFSMGSNLKSSEFPKEKQEVILRAFSKIKQTVLWKFEVDLPNKPKNLEIVKWLPQSDSLAHPNVRAFIGHGGLLGLTESVYHGIPILGLPVFWDQQLNIKSAIKKGYGIGIPYEDLNEENLSHALGEIINNPKYMENAKKYSRILRDEPMNQIDAAVFWIEYVHRHKGALHLRSPGLNLKWYQKYLLDIGILLFLTICIFVLVFKKIFELFQIANQQVTRSKKNK